MVTTLLFIATYVEAVSETLLAVNPLYFLIGAMYALTVVHALALRFIPSRRALAYAQVLGDLLILTVLVHFTGGVRTGFLLLYPALRALGHDAGPPAGGPGRRRGGDAALRGSPGRGAPRGVASRGLEATCWTSRAPPLLLRLRARRGLRDGGPPRLVPGGEPPARRTSAAAGGGRGCGPAGAQPGDRGQHPERPHHDRRLRSHPARQLLRRGHPGAIGRGAPRAPAARRPGLAAPRARRARSPGRLARPRAPRDRLSPPGRETTSTWASR